MNEQDFGGAVGLFNSRRFKFNLNKSKNEKIDELCLQYWVDLLNDEELAFFNYKIFKTFKSYLINDLMSASINKENHHRLKELKETIFTNQFKSISELPGFSDNPLNKQFWIFRGWDEKQAIQKISEKQKNNSNKYVNKLLNNPELFLDIKPNQIGYWLKKGYTEEESKQLVKERQSTFSLEKCIKKYGEINGIKKWQERQAKWLSTLNCKSKEELNEINLRKATTIENLSKKYGNEDGLQRYKMMMYKRKRTGLSNGTIMSSFKRTKKKNYYRKVWKYTYQNDLTALEDFYLRGSKYHLDHKISINFGYNNNIDPKIIGSINNLQMLPATENIKKRDKSYSKLKDNYFEKIKN